MANRGQAARLERGSAGVESQEDNWPCVLARGLRRRGLQRLAKEFSTRRCSSN